MAEQDNTPISRRAALVALTGGMGAALTGLPQPKTPEAPAEPDAGPGLAGHHLPTRIEDMLALSGRHKVIVAGIVASGCDAGAYYGLDGKRYARKEWLDLYPKRDHHANFAESVRPREGEKLADGIYRTVDAQGTTQYLIEVPGSDGRPKGIFALHASEEKYDGHESDEIKLAKLKLAQFVIREHADLLDVEAEMARRHEGLIGNAGWLEAIRRKAGEIIGQREEAHRELDNKLRYFGQLSALMYDTLGTEPPVPAREEHIKDYLLKPKPPSSAQKPHARGVTDIQMIAMGEVNKVHALGQEKAGRKNAPPLLDARQLALIRHLTELHDIGKVQFPRLFYTHNWQSGEDGKPLPKEELDRRWAHLHEHNHHHPLFTLLMLMLYKTDAIETAAHHHGIFRYTPGEIAGFEKNLAAAGFDAGKLKIVEEDFKPHQITTYMRMKRVSDVLEAMTASAMTADEAINALAGMAGVKYEGNNSKTGKIVSVTMKDPLERDIHPGSIDRRALAFFCARDVFGQYGRKRDDFCKAHGKEWLDRTGRKKYDPDKIAAAGKRVLDALGYDTPEKIARLEAEIAGEIARDPLIVENAVGGRARGR